MECRVCSAQSNLVDTYDKLAIEVSRLYVEPTYAEGAQLPLYGCPVCGHHQIPYINAEHYYAEYVMTASHSGKMQALQAGQITTLSSLASRRTSFVEVGCGDGSFLKHAGRFFERVVGIEPSTPFYELCIAQGLSVINEYLSDDSVFEHAFDAFASRQVLEHVEHPLQVLRTICGMCAEGAVGLIEVPNAQKMLSENRYFDLFSDHINYFTPLSLSYMAKNTGFEVVQLHESFGGDYLELYVRKRTPILAMATKRERDLAFILDSARKFGRVSAWGAGAKAQAIMTALGGRLSLRYLFDTDHHKQMKYLVNCATEIRQPTAETVSDNDLIIIFAASYQDEIIDLLKNTYGYSGDVVCLEGERPCIVRI